MSRERRLGRGLEALLGRAFETSEEPPTESDGSVWRRVARRTPHGPRRARANCGSTATRSTRNPYQPRQTFNEAEIADLADSIRAHGILQPLVVRQVDGRFELIAGERRLRAAQAADWRQVPVQIRDVSDRQMAELAIVENVQRKDLNAIEKAESFQRYSTSTVHSGRPGRPGAHRPLDGGQPDPPAGAARGVKQMVQDGDITQGHARALLPLGDEEEQREFAARIKKEGWSVRATEQAVQNHIHALDGDLLRLVDAEGNSRPVPKTRNEHLASLEQELRTALGTKVDLKQTAKGKGRITIHFGSHEQFDRLRQLLTATAAPAAEDAAAEQVG